jgi:hypothetical protein
MMDRQIEWLLKIYPVSNLGNINGSVSSIGKFFHASAFIPIFPSRGG